MTNLITALHVWTPDASGRLQCAQYVGDELPAASVTAEELGGLALQRKRPTVWQDEDHGHAAFALPTLDRGEVTAVTTLWLRVEAETTFGFELWSGRAGRTELALLESAYNGLDRFARISKFVNFPKRSGLPGRAWDEATPLIMSDLGQHPDFLRAAGAEAAGLHIGAALPVVNGVELQGVLLLLSSLDTPLFKAVEVFKPAVRGEASVTLQCVDGAYAKDDAVDGFAKAAGRVVPPPGVGWIGKAWASRKPVVVDFAQDQDVQRQAEAQTAGLRFGLAWPMPVLDDIRAVAVLGW